MLLRFDAALAHACSLALVLASSVLLCSVASAQSSQGGSVPLSPVPAGETRDAQARFGALRASPSGDVVVTAEHVSLSCGESPGALATCNVEVRWTLSSPHAQTIQLYASSVGVEEALLRAGDVSSDAPSLAPLAVTAEAATPIEVVLTGHFSVRSASGTTDALDARHLVLATPREGPHANVLFTRAVARTFAAVPPSPTLEARFTDTSAPFTASALDTPLADTPITLDPTRVGERANVTIRLGREGGYPLRHGGPFLALGGTFDRGVRGRLGYEVGIDELVVVSVAADTDFENAVIVGALVEVATPSFIVPPSLSAGVGFAYRVRTNAASSLPASSAGLRLELGAVFAVVGIIASFDYFPDDAAFTSSLLGRLSI
ncbi:MAG: hypothetical protein U0353_19175 [Sandaracinus sp.]